MISAAMSGSVELGAELGVAVQEPRLVVLSLVVSE